MDLVQLGIQCAIDDDFMSFESVHQVSAIEAIHIIAGREHKISAQVLDAIHRAGVGGPTHGFGLEHFLVRARQGMNVQRALTVGHLSAKVARSLRGCGTDQQK